MNTPTHSLLALALFSKQGQTRRNWAVFIGSLLPDAVIYLWAPYQLLIKGESGQRVWDVLYFQAPMQTAIALVNSIPIYSVLALIGLWLSTKAPIKEAIQEQRVKAFGLLLLVFSLAALSHILTDLPVHAHDAYRHFWPLSDFRFHSPFSYYETDKHSGIVSLIETLIALISIAILWRRFPKIWVKICLSLLVIFYIALQIIVRVVPFGGGA